MTKLKLSFVFIYVFVAVQSCMAMYYDNRFIPLLWKPFITSQDNLSHLRVQLFAVTARNAYDEHKDERPLPSIYDNFWNCYRDKSESKYMYNQTDLGNALTCLGCTNPLKSEWQGADIPWLIGGKFQGEGLSFSWQQAITDWFSFGVNSFVLNLDSWHEFALEFDKLSLRVQPEDCLELDEMRRQMHCEIGLRGDHAHHAGFGDTDIYLRFGYRWDYMLKFRSITAAARVGAIWPTASDRDECYAASISFGGNGHWGFFGAVESEFELREDWKAGLFFWLGKRLPKIEQRRIPVCREPQPYGAAVGKVRIDPGTTVACSPYLAFENLRDGFGLRAQYSLVFHTCDCWDIVSCPVKHSWQGCKINQWGSDYFTVAAFYDFRKLIDDCNWYPIVTLSWDIPAAVLVAENSAKTQRINLGVEWNF